MNGSIPAHRAWPLAVAAVVWLVLPARGQGVNEAYEKSAKDAASAAAPAVVRIETAGGRELIGGATAIGPGAGVRKGTPPGC
jgi:hypothetical protein